MGIALVLGFMICVVTTLTSAQFDPVTTRPLCVFQFALANYACKNLPYYPVMFPPPSPRIPPAPPVIKPPPAPEDPDGHRQHRHRHRHRHRGSPRSPPMPESSPDHNHHQHHRRHRHHNHRRRHHHHHHRSTPVEENCCRWLLEVDTQCVCEIMVHMPSFMSKPAHEYTVVVPEVCTVRFACPGRLRIE